MEENNKIADYITFPRTFEKYRWYKPILVFIIGFIILIILQSVIPIIFGTIFGTGASGTISGGGYEVLNTEWGEIISEVSVIAMIPALYIAAKIVRDRPFSSYSSSRGGWNFKLYFKALIIPLIGLLIYNAIETAIKGPEGNYHFSILFLIVSMIIVPLQCIAEEYVYRGLIMQTFGSWFKIPVVAILLQTILFSVSHGYNISGLMEIFVSGIVCGFLTWKTNGIEVSSALHTANNFALSLFIMFGLKSSTSTVPLTEAVMSIIFEIILCIIIYYIITKTDWLSEINEDTQNT